MGDHGFQGNRAASGRCRHIALCCSIAALAFAAFPGMAAAFAPLVNGVSGTGTSTGANLHGTIYPYGLDTTYRYEYGTTTSYGTNVPVPDADVGSAAYPATVQAPQSISGLPSGTTYHFRLVAHNSDGTASSTDQTFTTTGTPPSVSVEPATETAGGFNLSGSVNPQGTDTKYRFEYGTTTSYGTNIPVPDADLGSGTIAVPVSQEVTSLVPNTTYHFRLVAQNPGNSVPSGDQTFATPPSAPAAPSVVASPPIVIAGGYRLKGEVNPNSLSTSYHFELGTTTAYGTNLPAVDVSIGSGSNSVPVSQDATGLSANTTYHYRIVAHNTEGTNMSLDETFTTPPPAPVALSLPVTQTAEGFVLNGTINPNGVDTTYHFDFGITASYGTSVPSVDVDAGGGGSPVSVSQVVSGLPPNVPYHYRLVAHSSGGTTTGEDVFFMTPPEPTPETTPPAQLTPPPVIPPPAPAPPSNHFTTKAAAAKGGAMALTLGVPGPGSVSVSGKLLKGVKADAGSADTLSLKLKLTAAGMKALRKAKGGKLTVKVTIVFQPVGGNPSTVSKTLIFRKSG